MNGSETLTEAVRRLIDREALAQTVRIGATGHRMLDPSVEAWVAEELEGLFSYLADESLRGLDVSAISSLAVGADQLFVEAAIRHEIRVDVVIPFSNFREDFQSGPERETFERLLASTRSVTHLPWPVRSDGAYLAAGLWVVDHCDILFAVWNGEEATGIGGTGDVVRHARSISRPCVHLHSLAGRISVLE